MSALGRVCRALARQWRMAPYLADDLLADAMTIAFETAQEFDETDLRGWKARTRKRIRRRARGLIEGVYQARYGQPVPSSNPDPMAAVDMADELATLDEDSQVLLACTAYGLTECETATRLGVSQPTISRRLAALRNRLTA
jgi:DNA-directed RNA polymerase specialized sigma24 family protein